MSSSATTSASSPVEGEPRTGARGPRPSLARRLIGAHGPLLVVLVAAVAVRVLTAIAYWPGIMYRDSWSYLKIAYAGDPVGFGYGRPSGYSLLLRALYLPGRDPGTVIVVQQLAGLATGVLAYLLLLRLGARRWVATLGAALLLLNSYALALEVDLLSETFTTLVLLASFYVVLRGGRRPWAIVLSGLLLSAAVLMRLEVLFATPIWGLYLLWDRRWWQRLAIGAPTVIVPLIVYMALHASSTGVFGFSQIDGWNLYGRIGQIADCRGADIAPGARPLCQTTAARQRPATQRLGPIFYVLRGSSPANRLFGGFGDTNAEQNRSNRILKQFALEIIRHQPLGYVHLVADDFGKFFNPTLASGAAGHSDVPLTLPGRALIQGLAHQNSHALPDSLIRAHYLPHFTPHYGATAPITEAYGRWVHLSRWVTDVLFALALVPLALAATRRVAIPHRRAIFLLVGATLLMLLGSVATALFTLRYLLPATPLLVCAGLLGLEDLRALASRARARRVSRSAA